MNLAASWGYQMVPGEAQAHFFTGDVDRAKQALRVLSPFVLEENDRPH